MPDGIDLYIGACQNRGNNYVLLQSLSLEFEMINKKTKKSIAELEKMAEQFATDIRQQLGDDHPKIKEYTDKSKIMESLKYQNQNISDPLRFHVLYRADGVKRRLLSIDIYEKNLPDNTWKRKSIAIEDMRGIKNTVSAFYFSNQRAVFVGTTPSDSEFILNMGRLRGDGVNIVEAFFMTNTDWEKHEFSQENIDKFKAESKKQLSIDKTIPFKTVDTVWYDNKKSKAYVVESTKNGVVVERFWIDVSRGYVCPLIQYYDDKGILLCEYKASDFFLDKTSGMWFPAKYAEIEQNDNIQNEYLIDQTTLKINSALSDEQFFIDVPEGVVVNDERDNVSLEYKAIEKGILSLGEDGLNLEKMNWLDNISGTTSKKEWLNAHRIILFIIGLVAFITLVYRCRWHRP
jgi:hypothetical protein